MSSDPTLTYFEYNAINILPKDWDVEIEKVIEKYKRLNSAGEGSSVSRETELTDKQGIYMVTGDVILTELPWLYELYRSTFRDLAQKNSRKKY